MEFKNTSGDTVELPTLGLTVQPGETFTATGDDAKNLLASDSFERTDKPSKTSEKE